MKLQQVHGAGTQTRDILVVDGDGKTAELIRRAAPPGAAVRIAKGADQALCELKRKLADVVLVNVQLQDNHGAELLSQIRRAFPTATAVAVSRSQTPDACVSALRAGAADILFAPLKLEETRAVLDSSLRRTATQVQQAARHTRLRKVCKRLNRARHEISQQVDLLCNDLVRAYQDLAAQLNQTQAMSDFAEALGSQPGLEGLMRATLEWILRKLGPTNAAVFLPNSEGEYSLGAYLNLDTPASDPFVEAVAATIAPQAATGGLVTLENDRDVDDMFGAKGRPLLGRAWAAHGCFLRKECLGVVTIFRPQGTPIDPAIASLLQAISPILAERIGSAMHRHSRLGRLEDFTDEENGE